jgi:predicted AlkP superfamily pyrophosphatase or phosphodiesterase
LSRPRWAQNFRKNELNFYLNEKTLADKKIEKSALEDKVKALLVNKQGISHVITSTDVKKGNLPPGEFHRQILKSYYPGRSGDLIAIPKPFYFSSEWTGGVTHMTGYNYDRTVPIIIAGPNIKAGVYPHGEVVDIAPTLSFLLGVLPPALSEGRVLSEAIGK